MRTILLAVILLSTPWLLDCTQSQPPHTTAASQPADPCTPSQPIRAPAPQTVTGEPLDPSTEKFPWYFSADRAIRMYAIPLRQGRNKVAWFRPDGTDLQVSGRRIDAPAAPMTVDMSPLQDPHQFCPSILDFPTDGCWEITAKSGQSELRAVVKVSPQR